ncbi:MAG: type VI secretion system ATPase TssH [Candidatus Adiutrix sp.]|jgi:type VI secretion system protein VasG|nr:type VI secretion system ATPase TssH [Candidatus Adiutrix sp.]
MIGSDIKALVNKCNVFCTQALLDAAGLAVNRSNYEVAPEHFLLKCLENPDCDMSVCLARNQVDRAEVILFLNAALENFRSGNSARPAFSPVLLELLEAAWILASVDLGLGAVRSGAVLLAYLKRPNLYSQGGQSRELSKISRDDLEKNFREIILRSSEDAGAETASEKIETAVASGSGESFVAKFCEDFTAKARAGKLDPVFGRNEEIRSMINILARRRKNNPILVGEPGVGKTAVIEGLAIRIIKDDVPEVLKGVTLLGLDMGLLEAGASVKGEFERRLKGVIDEIKSSPKPVVLFIDEAHMLVGAGNAAGGSDAANLLKPALSRGELKTCAATTWKEYKKYFEKDPALARRFQLVSLDEPSPATTALILRGLRDSYEACHQVLIRDEALEAAADLSGRFITGRFLPDKAIDLLDTACARVKIGLSAPPAPLEDAIREARAVERELGGLKRDQENGHPADDERMAALSARLEDLSKSTAGLTERWEKEKAAARNLVAARAACQEALKTEKQTAESPAEPAGDGLKAELDKALAEYKALADEEGGGLLDVEVTADVVARVVSDWTGIPVGKIAREQAAVVADLENRLTARIKGQGQAVAAVAEVLKASKAGLRDPAQPLGVFLLVGPSGVGKTETGLALADILFGDESSVVSINMSEFQEKHTVSRLVGSPPGYVGYGEGGLLTEAVRRKPYCVILLDEVEKAHLDVINLFYQVFDKGVLTDGEGKKISFRNTIIMLTSNLASDGIEDFFRRGLAPDLAELTAEIRPRLSAHFKPALLARMNIVPYRGLDDEALARITRLKLDLLAERLRNNNGSELKYSPAVVDTIVERCREVETGARNIDYVLAANVLPQMAREILSRMSSEELLPPVLALDIGPDGAFNLNFDAPA